MKNPLIGSENMLQIKRMPLTADREALVKLRLKRWQARAWMKSHGVLDLGKTIQAKDENA